MATLIVTDFLYKVQETLRNPLLDCPNACDHIANLLELELKEEIDHLSADRTDRTDDADTDSDSVMHDLPAVVKLGGQRFDDFEVTWNQRVQVIQRKVTRCA